MRVTLKQFVGTNRGLSKTEPIDIVLAERKDGTLVKVGLIHWCTETLFFVRFLDVELCDKIHAECQAIRYAAGRPAIRDKYVRPPNPLAIRAALKGQRRGKKKTTSSIILPDGYGNE